MTRFGTILAPVDFSDHSKEALDTAVPSWEARRTGIDRSRETARERNRSSRIAIC